ncbi:hypothetical protein DOM22_18780 [Bdellovibrio sp. ZAP7]|uniref:hypothetical protein n=1 Tax=Bdellovibrio sp. ZAP7 TaxID=2231053 RepID=UPI00115B398F|nr:hypothetical protein [Bdellovibrio sp. ZAP7]QDK47060.1 hypothetical protein DOM22_18780 [Bdellovibrio sp. ZAP7]
MSSTRTAKILWVLWALFVCRVLGQLIVVLYAPDFLPPMKEWYSGLMPYQYLLPTQILIIGFFAKIASDISRGIGRLSKPHQKLGLFLRNFGYFYFGAMIFRYVLRMSMYPEERWFGGTIPIIFHFVLATFLIVWGKYNLRQSPTSA